jgi:hypothetical protein
MENLFPNRRWLVLPTSVLESVNFDQVLEHSVENLRLSIDGAEALVSYDVTIIPETYTQTGILGESGDIHEFTVEAGTYGRPSIYNEGTFNEYNHVEILELMLTDKWSPKIIEN